MAKAPTPRNRFGPRPMIPPHLYPQASAVPPPTPPPERKPFNGAAADHKAGTMQRIISALQQVGCKLVTKPFRAEALKRQIVIPEDTGGETMLFEMRAQRVISVGLHQVYCWHLKTATRNRGSVSIASGALVKALDDSMTGNTDGPFAAALGRLGLG